MRAGPRPVPTSGQAGAGCYRPALLVVSTSSHPPQTVSRSARAYASAPRSVSNAGKNLLRVVNYIAVVYKRRHAGSVQHGAVVVAVVRDSNLALFVLAD